MTATLVALTLIALLLTAPACSKGGAKKDVSASAQAQVPAPGSDAPAPTTAATERDGADDDLVVAANIPLGLTMGCSNELALQSAIGLGGTTIACFLKDDKGSPILKPLAAAALRIRYKDGSSDTPKAVVTKHEEQVWRLSFVVDATKADTIDAISGDLTLEASGSPVAVTAEEGFIPCPFAKGCEVLDLAKLAARVFYDATQDHGDEEPLPDRLPQTQLFFLTDTYVHGDFGGVAAADAICQREGEALNPTGRFIALISSPTQDARDRIAVRSPVFNVRNSCIGASTADLADTGTCQGVDVFLGVTAKGFLSSKPIQGIDTLDYALFAWTASDKAFRYSAAGGDCAGWTSAKSSVSGGIGRATGEFYKRFDNGGKSQGCDSVGRFYCLEL